MIISKSNGKCVACPDYKHPNIDFKECINDGPCNEKNILQIDGTCKECPSGTRPDETGLVCKFDDCDVDTQISDDLGYCITCDLYTKPNKDSADGEADNSFCVSDSCVENQILKQDGTCDDCDDYTHPDTSVRNCIQCDMTGRDRDIWTITGQCFTCPDKTYPGPQKHECVSDDCDLERGFLRNDGTCNICDDWYYPNEGSMTCE